MKKIERRYSLNDIAWMSDEEWKALQPLYKNLAYNGYFTHHLPYTDFYTSFYQALEHPLPLGADPHEHLKHNLLVEKNIIDCIFFIPDPERQTLELLAVYVKTLGYWAVLWRVIIHLCYKYGLRRLRLRDGALFGDPWTHYGFSGELHDLERELVLF